MERTQYKNALPAETKSDEAEILYGSVLGVYNNLQQQASINHSEKITRNAKRDFARILSRSEENDREYDRHAYSHDFRYDYNYHKRVDNAVARLITLGELRKAIHLEETKQVCEFGNRHYEQGKIISLYQDYKDKRGIDTEFKSSLTASLNSLAERAFCEECLKPWLSNKRGLAPNKFIINDICSLLKIASKEKIALPESVSNKIFDLKNGFFARAITCETYIPLINLCRELGLKPQADVLMNLYIQKLTPRVKSNFFLAKGEINYDNYLRHYLTSHLNAQQSENQSQPISIKTILDDQSKGDGFGCLQRAKSNPLAFTNETFNIFEVDLDFVYEKAREFYEGISPLFTSLNKGSLKELKDFAWRCHRTVYWNEKLSDKDDKEIKNILMRIYQSQDYNYGYSNIFHLHGITASLRRAESIVSQGKKDFIKEYESLFWESDNFKQELENLKGAAKEYLNLDSKDSMSLSDLKKHITGIPKLHFSEEKMKQELQSKFLITDKDNNYILPV